MAEPITDERLAEPEALRVQDEEIDSAIAAASHPDAPYDPAGLTLAAAVRQLRGDLARAERYKAQWRRQAETATGMVEDLRQATITPDHLLDMQLTDVNALEAQISELIGERDEAQTGLAEYLAESTRLGEVANDLVQKLKAAHAARERIAEAHSKHVDRHGGTWGECNECGHRWPCPTYVWATTDRDPNATWDPADDEPDADGGAA